MELTMEFAREINRNRSNLENRDVRIGEQFGEQTCKNCLECENKEVGIIQNLGNKKYNFGNKPRFCGMKIKEFEMI